MTKQNKDELHDVLHDLDHQKYEAIGVEQLAKEAGETMSAVMLIIKFMSTNSAQDLAVLYSLAELMEREMCDKCIDLSTRIRRQIITDFETWKLEKRR